MKIRNFSNQSAVKVDFRTPVSVGGYFESPPILAYFAAQLFIEYKNNPLTFDMNRDLSRPLNVSDNFLLLKSFFENISRKLFLRSLSSNKDFVLTFTEVYPEFASVFPNANNLISVFAEQAIDYLTFVKEKEQHEDLHELHVYFRDVLAPLSLSLLIEFMNELTSSILGERDPSLLQPGVREKWIRYLVCHKFNRNIDKTPEVLQGEEIDIRMNKASHGLTKQLVAKFFFTENFSYAVENYFPNREFDRSIEDIALVIEKTIVSTFLKGLIDSKLPPNPLKLDQFTFLNLLLKSEWPIYDFLQYFYFDHFFTYSSCVKDRFNIVAFSVTLIPPYQNKFLFKCSKVCNLIVEVQDKSDLTSYFRIGLDITFKPECNVPELSDLTPKRNFYHPAYKQILVELGIKEFYTLEVSGADYSVTKNI